MRKVLHRWRRSGVMLAIPALVATAFALPQAGVGRAGVDVVRSSVKVSDGRTFTATNHLVQPASGLAGAFAADQGGEYLLVWAGDSNASDNTSNTLASRVTRGPTVNLVQLQNEEVPDDSVSNDFLAVIDADASSPNYGKVVNTITVSPIVENEPHHMQYIWHKGNLVYAGGLFSDTTYVFDVSKLPTVSLAGVNLPTDTPCGSVPDAYWVLKDGTAYGTYMGGPDLPGPCAYTDGSTAIGNGFAGTPGELVHIGKDGSTLSETKATTDTAADTDATNCPSVTPLPVASCANPHGIQVREDLHRMITTDYAEPRNVPIDPVKPAEAGLFRDTVRVWDITNENAPKVTSVSVMPDGPRVERNPGHEEMRGMMEGTVTNLPQHKGAFSESMCGGVIYYTPDITAKAPAWKEVFDDTTASRALNPNITEGAGCDGGGWVQTSLDDRYLYHAVIGRNPGALEASDPGVPKMVYVLDIQKLLAAGSSPKCSITKISEVYDGGSATDCPALAGVLPISDLSSGGPHWGTFDNFVKGSNGLYAETTNVKRIAVSDYFVARSGVDGDHKVCMINASSTGKLTLDTSFRDEHEGTPCVDFNRTIWPQGPTGNAKPHSELFVVTSSLVK